MGGIKSHDNMAPLSLGMSWNDGLRYGQVSGTGLRRSAGKPGGVQVRGFTPGRILNGNVDQIEIGPALRWQASRTPKIYIIAVGGAGSSGLPALFNGPQIIA